MILASHGIIGSQIVQFSGLLDTYTGAAAAYSLRLLRTAYTGYAIKVRRASDNTEQDIGFSNNELDTTTLVSFCSGTDGFVTTWYDQSGNGNDATQTTAAAQPKIYDSSTGVITENVKAAVQFDGSSDFLHKSISTSGAYSNYVVLKSNTQTGFRGIFTTSQMMMLGLTDVNKWGTYGSLTTQSANTDIRGAYNMIAMISPSGSSGTFYRNGSTDGTYSSSSSQNTSTLIGGITKQYISANIQEIIFWQIDQSSNRTGIETNINDYYAIY